MNDKYYEDDENKKNEVKGLYINFLIVIIIL